MEKEGTAKSTPKKKKKKRRVPNIKRVFTDLHEESDENAMWILWLEVLLSIQSAQNRDCITSQICEKWSHEVCAGALCRKQFRRGKCL